MTKQRIIMKKPKISKRNLRSLESIKEIIEVEEERKVTLRTLDRVLNHYRSYVPYQTC